MRKTQQIDALWAGLRKSDGSVLAAGKVYTYEPGGVVARTTWLDSEKVSAAANPIILDSAGRAEIYADGVYRLRIFDSDNNEVMDIDPVKYYGELCVEGEYPVSTWTPTITISGTGITVSAPVIVTAKYQELPGELVWVNCEFNCTLTGAGSAGTNEELIASLPPFACESTNHPSAGFCRDASSGDLPAGICNINNTGIVGRKVDNADWTAGTGRTVRMSGIYRKA